MMRNENIHEVTRIPGTIVQWTGQEYVITWPSGLQTPMNAFPLHSEEANAEYHENPIYVPTKQ